MTDQPTPRPWTATYRLTGLFRIEGPEQEVICETGRWNEKHFNEMKANAELIVRAVNRDHLFDQAREALEIIANITDGHPVDADRRDRINQLAKVALAAMKGK